MNDTTPPTEPNKPEGNAPKPSKPEASNGDALVQPELPEFKGGVNAVTPAINEVPEYGANNPEIKKVLEELEKIQKDIDAGNKDPKLLERRQELREAFDILSQNLPAINEVPAFDLSKLGAAHPGVDFGQKAPEVKEQAKVEAKNVKSLPNTGMNSSSTTALGLSLIGLIGLAVRRKLSK